MVIHHSRKEKKKVGALLPGVCTCCHLESYKTGPNKNGKCTPDPRYLRWHRWVLRIVEECKLIPQALWSVVAKRTWRSQEFLSKVILNCCDFKCGKTTPGWPQSPGHLESLAESDWRLWGADTQARDPVILWRLLCSSLPAYTIIFKTNKRTNKWALGVGVWLGVGQGFSPIMVSLQKSGQR